MNISPGESYQTSAATVTVKNLDSEKLGYFSVEGANYQLNSGETKVINLMVSPDKIMNAGKTILDVTDN